MVKAGLLAAQLHHSTIDQQGVREGEVLVALQIFRQGDGLILELGPDLCLEQLLRER
jgi:hypothetical protein